MKYFVDEKDWAGTESEGIIEFKAPSGQSLYMSEAVMHDSGFYDFWLKCMQDDIVFDMDTISKNELLMMCFSGFTSSENVTAILSELHTWAEPLLDGEDGHIEIIRDCDQNTN